jgi:glycosyltransferase involved in cell wall biosynthesis
MDVANHALASYFAGRGDEVHLVAHQVADDLARRENVTVHQVPKPAGSYLLGEPLIERVGRKWAAQISARGGRVLVNGGNCRWGDVNWVHYLHAAYVPAPVNGVLRSAKNAWVRRRHLASERDALRRARVVITNSERTRADVVERLRAPPSRVHAVYYGTDGSRFRPPTAEEREKARASLSWPAGIPFVVFIGALGDHRKGFDSLFSAWTLLCADPHWDVQLAVVGTGTELPLWKHLASRARLDGKIRFLGFREDVPTILAACDALVAPTRYEAYGLGVQEALCCGLPAFVTETAGVAEQYPADLRDLLIPDPDDAAALADRLRGWRRQQDSYRTRVADLSRRLRSHTWDQMAAQIGRIIDA